MSQRAVLFDFGGVLIQMDWDSYDALAQRWNLPAGVLADAFYRTPEWHAIETGEGNWDTWQRGVERKLAPWLADPTADVRAILDAWYAQPWQYHLPNFQLAHDLQAAGHKIGLLSNAPDDLRARFLDNLPIEVHWDAIVVSGEIGLRKPDPTHLPPRRRADRDAARRLLLHRRPARERGRRAGDRDERIPLHPQQLRCTTHRAADRRNRPTALSLAGAPNPRTPSAADESASPAPPAAPNRPRTRSASDPPGRSTRRGVPPALSHHPSSGPLPGHASHP